MATTRRRRIEAHRQQHVRGREFNRRRDATAQPRPAQALSGNLLKAMAWAALVLLLGATLLVVILG